MSTTISFLHQTKEYNMAKTVAEIQQYLDEANNLQRFDAALQKLTPEQREMLNEVLNIKLTTEIEE